MTAVKEKQYQHQEIRLLQYWYIFDYLFYTISYTSQCIIYMYVICICVFIINIRSSYTHISTIVYNEPQKLEGVSFLPLLRQILLFSYKRGVTSYRVSFLPLPRVCCLSSRMYMDECGRHCLQYDDIWHFSQNARAHSHTKCL